MKRLLLAALAVVALAGCGAQKDHAFQDAPPDQKYTDNSPAQVINFPDQYPNAVMKCDHHGHLLYATTRDNRPLQVVPSKDCPNDWPAPEAAPR